MPQNPKKYYYINRVGFAHGSWALQKFLEDCARHHMEDQPSKLAALRLTEYYELIERMNSAGSGVPALPAGGNETPIATTPSSRRRRVVDEQQTAPPQEPEEPEKLSEEEALNESADYWGAM